MKFPKGEEFISRNLKIPQTSPVVMNFPDKPVRLVQKWNTSINFSLQRESAQVTTRNFYES